jgi:hypothetical protein
MEQTRPHISIQACIPLINPTLEIKQKTRPDNNILIQCNVT